MTDLEDLQRKERDAEVIAEQAGKTRDGVKAAWAAISPARKTAESKRVTAERELGDELIEFYAGRRTKRPDLRVLDELRNEADVIRIAIKRLDERLAASQVAALDANARLLVAQANTLDCQANIEEQAALAALGTISGALGENAAVELRGTIFQRLRLEAAEKIEQSARLRKEADGLIPQAKG